MLQDKIDLGLKTLICKNWKWLPGMRWFFPLDINICGRINDEGLLPPDGAIPDFSDHATLGGLIKLNREHFQKEDLYAYHFGANVWRVGNFQGWMTFILKETNEVEALLISLEECQTKEEWTKKMKTYKCKGVIPNTFIVCGEEGNFCSEECI
jgi:hypothetical protein